MSVSDWSTTPGSNTTLEGINVAENCPPGNINNVIRAIAAAIKSYSLTVPSAATLQPLDATLTALAGVSTAANKLIYATGADAFATTTLTAFARTLLDDASAVAARATLGAVGITAASLANPGYIKLSINGTDLMFQWGTGSLSGNATGSVAYPQAYNTFSIPVISGSTSNVSNEGDVASYGSSSTTGFNIANSNAGAATYYWISVGV